MTNDGNALTALALVCSLKSSPAASSSELIAEHVFNHLREQNVKCEALRCVDFAIAPGVEADMGDGDQWPTSSRPSTTSDTAFPRKVAPTGMDGDGVHRLHRPRR